VAGPAAACAVGPSAAAPVPAAASTAALVRIALTPHSEHAGGSRLRDVAVRAVAASAGLRASGGREGHGATASHKARGSIA